MAKSWLHVQVDLELAHLEPGRMDQFKSIGDAIDGSPGHSDGAVQPSNGPGIWPLQVFNQQPRQLSDLLQKLQSGYIYNAVFILILSCPFLQYCLLLMKECLFGMKILNCLD